MAKKDFINPFVIASGIGEVIVTPDVSGQSSTGPVSYNWWLATAEPLWDDLYPDGQPDGQLDENDYLCWWYDCMVDTANFSGFTPEAYLELNGSPLPPDPRNP